MPRSPSLLRLAPLLALALTLGCALASGPPRSGSDDEDAGDGVFDDNNEPDNNQPDNNDVVQDAGDGDPSDVGPADADVGEDAAEPDVGEDAPPPECEAGERRCEPDGQLTTCTPTGQWATRPCSATETCIPPGACFDDPAACVDGELGCLTGDQPAQCDAAGAQWVELERCGEGQACVDGECRSQACALAQANASYIGCDYVSVDLPNLSYTNTPPAPVGVVLANTSDTEVARVSALDPQGQPAALVGQVVVSPPSTHRDNYAPVTVRSNVTDADGQVVNSGFTAADGLEIPPRGMAVLLREHHGDVRTTRVRPWALHVRSDQPLAAYQYSPYCCNFSFTNDASLLFPTPTLGQEYVYLGVPPWSGGNFQAYMTLIGVQDDTEVQVQLAPGASVSGDGDGRVAVQNGVASATLGRGEVLHLMSTGNGDLSGSRITSTAPISAFAGHLCTNYPANTIACDHLEEQLVPVDTWGSAFVLVPPALRSQNPGATSEATYWKLVADADGTTVELSADFTSLSPRAPGFNNVPHCQSKLSGPRTITLNAGEHCEFGTRQPVEVDASGPIMVMGVISGQGSTGVSTGGAVGAHAGDPAIFILAPERQFRTRYAFLAPGTYFNDYVTLVAQPNTTITLDGDPVDMSAATPVPGGDHEFVHVLIDDGPHTLEGSRPFGILAYAYDDWVSYAYTGGLNLTKGR